MKKKRIIRTAEVTIETEETTVLRPSSGQRQDGHSALMWCPSCRRQVEMVTLAHAARLAGVTSRAIYRSLEDGKFHLSEASNASLLICRRSLQNHFAANNRGSHQ